VYTINHRMGTKIMLPATQNMNGITVARHTLNNNMVSYWSCDQVFVNCVRRYLARRSDETRIRAWRYKRVRLGWKDTCDVARPRLTFPTKSPCATGSSPWSPKSPFTSER
jgi:hypothetical protein